jgi:hypothetical protein
MAMPYLAKVQELSGLITSLKRYSLNALLGIASKTNDKATCPIATPCRQCPDRVRDP